MSELVFKPKLETLAQVTQRLMSLLQHSISLQYHNENLIEKVIITEAAHIFKMTPHLSHTPICCI
jgi:hypothetical protein